MAVAGRVRVVVLALGLAVTAAACSMGTSPAAATSARLTASRPAGACRVDGSPPAAGSRATVRAGPVTYGEDDGPLTGILDLPHGLARLAPAILLVHGGSWVHGTPAEMAPPAQVLTAAGFVTLNIAYRLATPGHPGFPSELGDLQQAVRFLRTHSDALDVDPTRIGVLGSSAGANLALLLATTGAGSCSSGTRVAAVAAWSPPIAVTEYGQTAVTSCTANPGRCTPLFEMANEYIGCSWRSCPARWRAASIPEHVALDDPPMLIFNSTDELIPLAPAEALDRQLGAVGVPHQLVVFPGHLHASAYAPEALARTTAFFRRTLG